jgi:HK97 family phage portal protein
MGILKTMTIGAVAGADAQTLNAYTNGDDYWYTPRASPTMAGVTIDTEKAITISTVFACVRVIAETIATLPLDIYRRNADGSKQKDPKHRLQSTLHSQANPNMTAVDFREMMTALALMRGAAYAYIDEQDEESPWLYPLHPDLMEVRRYGEYGQVVRYFYGREKKEIPAENLVKLRGFDGIGLVNIARESMALTLATEQYGSRFFGQGQRPVGFLSVPQNDKRVPMKDETFERIRKQLRELYAGIDKAHQIAVLEDGVTWQAMGLSAEQSQFLETRRFQTEEIARWFRVQPHKIGHLDKATYSNIEQQSIEFVTDTLRPWMVRWEQTIRRDLIGEPDFFAEHNADAILRGDAASRYTAYATAIDKGIMSPNEVRAKENLNARDDEWGDAFVRNLNQTTTADEDDPEPAAEPPQPTRPFGAPTSPPPPADVEDDAHVSTSDGTSARLHVRTSVRPNVRRESALAKIVTAAATRLAEREVQFLRTHPAATKDEQATFYARQAAIMQEALCIDEARAVAYCEGQRARLEFTGREKLLSSTDKIVDELCALALAEEEEAHA